MLKITNDGTASEQRWILCGQLSGPWVEEFRSIWEGSRGKSNGEPCIVDLSEVTSIDEAGETLLRTMKQNGVHFVARGVDMRHILNHLRSKSKPSLRRSLAHLDRDAGRS
jgi:anti-anti-sigma regulatory factor